MAGRDEYSKKIKSKINEWDVKIDKLEAKLKETKAEAKIKYENQIKELRGLRDKARQKLQELNQAQEGVWEEMKEGINKAVDTLKETYEKVKSRFD